MKSRYMVYNAGGGVKDFPTKTAAQKFAQEVRNAGFRGVGVGISHVPSAKPFENRHIVSFVKSFR